MHDFNVRCALLYLSVLFSSGPLVPVLSQPEKETFRETYGTQRSRARADAERCVRYSRRVSTKERRIIEDAAKLIGRERLAKELGVDDRELAEWIEGEADITGNTFKKLSEVLVKIASQKPAT